VITLWELGGKNGRRYSLFSWRTRMALRHKGLEFESRPVCMSDKAAIAFSGGKTVPVIQDRNGGEVHTVRDSWKIAEHLEARYPDQPSLFGGPVGHGLTHSYNVWVDRAVVPAMLPVIVADIHERVDPADDAYFREMMEKILRTTLEQARAGREQGLQRLGKVLEPTQSLLKRQAYVCGAAPAYADYALFSVFQWARVMSPQEVLGPEDPLCAWRERMSDLFGGFARNVPLA
jgi:glutathione S-transferase